MLYVAGPHILSDQRVQLPLVHGGRLAQAEGHQVAPQLNLLYLIYYSRALR